MSRRAMMVAPAVAVGGGGFGFYRSITIDHTQCGSTDSSNWPLLVSLTNASLKTTGNGGNVESSSGYDIGFYAESALTTKLDWEVEKYVASTGEIIAHVRIPTLSHTSDTVIYLAYGSSSITTDQSNPAGVWNTNFKVVQHFGDGTTLSLADSTSNGNNGTGNNTPTPAAGQVYGGITNSADNSIYEKITIGDPASQNAVSVSFWFKSTNVGAGQRGAISWSGNDPFGISLTPFILIQLSNATLQFYVDSNYREFSQTLTVNTWYHIAVTLASATTWKFYLNGSGLSTYTGGVANRSGSDTVFFGTGYNGQSLSVRDELRIAYATMSSDWVLAEYNNQKASSTMITLGSETPT